MQYDITTKVIVEKGKHSLFRYFQKRQPMDIEIIESLPQELPSLKKGDYLLKIKEQNDVEEIQVWEFKTEWKSGDILNLMDYTIRAKQVYNLARKASPILVSGEPGCNRRISG